MILSNFFILIFITLLGKAFLSFRYQDNKKTILIYAISLLLMSFLNYNGLSNNIAFLVFILLISYVVIQFEGKLLKKLILVISFYILLAISEITTLFILNLLVDLNENTNIQSIKYFSSLIISNSLNFIFVLFYIKIFKFIKANDLPKYTWLILILPLTTITLILNIPNYYLVIQNNISLLFILFGLFIANIISILIFMKAIQSMKYKNELTLTKYREKYSQTKYNLLDNQYKNSFQLLHEILNKCQHLSISLNENKYDKVKEELTNLTELVFKDFNNVYTNSIVLNTLIHEKLSKIKDHNIQISSTIEFNDFNFIDFCDQIDLFGNILDYAIQSVLQSNFDKNIIIKSKLISNQLFLVFQFCTKERKEKDIKLLIEPILIKYNADFSISSIANQRMSILLHFPYAISSYIKERTVTDKIV